MWTGHPCLTDEERGSERRIVYCLVNISAKFTACYTLQMPWSFPIVCDTQSFLILTCHWSCGKTWGRRRKCARRIFSFASWGILFITHNSIVSLTPWQYWIMQRKEEPIQDLSLLELLCPGLDLVSTGHGQSVLVIHFTSLHLHQAWHASFLIIFVFAVLWPKASGLLCQSLLYCWRSDFRSSRSCSSSKGFWTLRSLCQSPTDPFTSAICSDWIYAVIPMV